MSTTKERQSGPKGLRNQQSQSSMAEVAEFLLGRHHFGINGSKIKQLVLYDPEKVTRPPYNHPSVSGLLMFRGHTVPLIDLYSYLEIEPANDGERQVAIVTEFNETTTAFIASKVNRIHRIDWTALKPLDSYLVKLAPQIIGSITIEQREILVLDLEQIVGEIIPASITNYNDAIIDGTKNSIGREDVKIFFAEDSYIIRTKLASLLNKLGYTNITEFAHGRAALDAIKEAQSKADAEGKPLTSVVDLLITDIEMPQMDGLALCETIKKQLGYDIPILMFSSLINDQLAKKCQAAGADHWVSKPQTERLIELIDELALKR